MKVSRVSKMSPEARFLYWIRERHAIYMRRKEGKPKPWTDDEILQSYFFTNPYRENDKTTVWFRENVRGPMKNGQEVIFATVCFRWFNYIPTGEILLRQGLLTKWNPEKARQYLLNKGKVFTGAFMIPAPPGVKKLDHVCGCLDNVWCDRKDLASRITGTSMQKAHSILLEFPYLGGFMAYEVVTDLRYTHVLNRANDKLTWCNPGPGCARGLLRMNGVNLSGVPAAHRCRPPEGWKGQLIKLREVASKKLSDMPRIEMREIEHSLCEWDKYERARTGDGRMKRRYNGSC